MGQVRLRTVRRVLLMGVMVLGVLGLSWLAVGAEPPTGGSSLGLPIVRKVRPTPTATPIPPIDCNIPAESYHALSTNNPDLVVDTTHADLNLSVRGYEPTDEALTLIDYNGDTDAAAPQLKGLFSPTRPPRFVSTYRVYDWNWSCNCRGGLLPLPGQSQHAYPVTAVGLEATHGQAVLVPDRQGGLLNPGDSYKVLVIFASENQLTLKYTRDDDVVVGYTLHLQNVCVEPRLLALYRSGQRNGRHELPALRPGQAMGRVRGDELVVAIRDWGTFMDPRSRKDWWR